MLVVSCQFTAEDGQFQLTVDSGVRVVVVRRKNIGLESSDCFNMKPPLAMSVKMVLVNIIEATCVAVGCR